MSGNGEPLLGSDAHLLRRGVAGADVSQSWFIDAERVVKIALNPDDELRNLQVALCYSLTSTRMAERISWSANPGDLRSRTNANWFSVAQWAVLTVGRDMRNSSLPHRFAALPDVLRRRLTPAVLSLRSSDDRKVAASLSFGQVVVFCSIYRALLFNSHFADGLPMTVPDGRPPQEDDPIAQGGGSHTEPPEAPEPGGPDVVTGDPAVTAMLERMAAADEERLRANRERDSKERETVVALARQLGADTRAIDPDPSKDKNEFYASVLHVLANLCPYRELLKDAFTLYQQAARWVNAPEESEIYKTQRAPADLIFEANMRIAAIEQVTLDKPITAVIDQVPNHISGQAEGRMATFAERSLRVPRFIAQVNSATRIAGATAIATDLWARVMTDQVMVLALPSETLRLGRDLPSRDWRKPFYAEDLLTLSPEAQELFDRFDRSLGDGRGAAAGDWRRIDDRMNFAVNLIRSRQQDPSLFWQPFTDEDVAKIWNGQYPSRIADPFEQAIRSPSTVFANDFDVAGALTFTSTNPPPKTEGGDEGAPS